MALSTYQIERFLERLRRFRGWLLAPEHPPEAPVRPTQPDVTRVREPARYPLRVEAERERRAGSFMDPPYPGTPATAPIPRLRPVRSGAPSSSASGDEDASGIEEKTPGA